MQLILHIGTHKTGTTAMQECLYRNEERLAGGGIHYAHRLRARSFNQLAKLVATDGGAKPKPSLTVMWRRRAHSARHTLLISAESFFAMTMFLHKLEGGVARNIGRPRAHCY